ncbi:MAG TPA: trypsin-like peptidase domain-containing protein [Actinomycetota bacterium]
MKRWLIALGTGSALLLGACSQVVPQDVAEPRAFPSPQDSPIESTGVTSVEDVVDAVLPAVVNVVTQGSQGRGGEGTGFVVREDGIVVTNYHVVESASAITVLSSDEEPVEYPARVIGGDVQADLAVLDVEARGLQTVPMGDSDDLRLGQPVVAIGYALGLEGGPSVTSGIVSSLTRRITVDDPNFGRRVYTDVIQTDAAINPGNSGGPLVDMAGNVVGINTAGTTSADNVGFAIQIDSAKPTIAQAAENPDEPVAYLGIAGPVEVSDPQVQFEIDPPVDRGVLLQEVVADGPAAAAGLASGDIVVEFDGEEIATADDLVEAIRSHAPGDRVPVVVVRGDGQRVEVTVELGVNPVPVDD